MIYIYNISYLYHETYINPSNIGVINQLSSLWGTTSYNSWFTPSDMLADATSTPQKDHEHHLETSKL